MLWRVPGKTAKRGRAALAVGTARALLAATIFLLFGVAGEVWLRFDEGRTVAPFEFDPVLGWNARLRFEGRHRSPEFDVAIRTNGQHMRAAQDYAQRPAGFRIAVVGDSFAWGHGVEAEERFTERMQEMLGPGFEVLNFGIGGYGTDQYLLKIQREVLAFEPSLVLVAFFINDLYELLRGRGHLGIYKPRYELRRGRLELARFPVPRTPRWDRRRGIFDLLLLERLRAAFAPGPGVAADLAPEADHFYAPNPQIEFLSGARPERTVGRMLRLNAGIFREIRDTTAAAGVPLVVAEVPFQEFFIPDATLKAVFDLEPEDFDRGLTQREMRRLSAELGFAYVDPYAAFAADSPLECYFRRDQHFNARGHELFARVLVSALREQGLLPER